MKRGVNHAINHQNQLGRNSAIYTANKLHDITIFMKFSWLLSTTGDLLDKLKCPRGSRHIPRKI